MAGIYIHIPFCRKRCTYCDFYTEVAPNLTENIVHSIVQELILRKNYLNNASVDTIYFGGGTPSILNAEQFGRIFNTIYRLFEVNEKAEITFEANPDDLTSAYLNSIKHIPFNRISIGIQSFDDLDLVAINRRHTGQQAIHAVNEAKAAGFTNISIDLIYGLPNQTIEKWEIQLKTALDLKVQHISAYGLTYEENTALWKQRHAGKVTPVDDYTMNQMYFHLLNATAAAGFIAYEISNFSLPGFKSRHNTSYWQQKPYLGVGPSAHSYNLQSRQWNVSSNAEYIKCIQNNSTFYEVEELSINDRYNDYIMVSLRTSDGISIELIETEFGTKYVDYCIKSIEKFIERGDIVQLDNKFRLTQQGITISNMILIDMMKV